MESAVVEHGVCSVHFLGLRGLSVEAEQSKEPKHGSEKEPMSHIRFKVSAFATAFPFRRRPRELPTFTENGISTRVECLQVDI